MRLGYVAIHWLFVGVFMYAGLSHLQIGLRRPFERLHVLFGVLSFCTAWAALTGVLLATARDPNEYLAAAWQSSIVVTLLYIVLPWFIRDYFAQVQRWPALIVATPYVMILAVNALLPFSVLQSEMPVLTQLNLPWGEQITISSTPPSAWLQVAGIAHVLTVVYLIASIIHAARCGLTRAAWSLGISAVPLVAVIVINGLTALGIVRSGVYFGVFGFLAMMLLMNALLSDARRRSSKQMQIVLDNVPAIVYLKHLNGRYAFVNRSFEQLHGIAHQHALDKTDTELLGSAGAEHFHRADDEVIAAGQSIESEFTFNRDGETRAYASVHFPLRDTGGSIYGVCGISTDITDRKAAADTLRELANGLERRVARRTYDLANVNRELEAFSYSVSHDLRAPLMTVNGFADLLLRDHAASLDQTGQKYLQRIRDGALRMGKLIDDLLALSRVTREDLQRVPVDLSTLARDTIRALQESDPARNVHTDIAPELPAQGDARLLGLVLGNLIGNAWKYTGRCSEPRIEIGMFEQNGERVYFVRDNGAGFDPTYIDRLFQPFKRLHSEQEFPGSGVGLATAARIVRRHGGRIWAEGKPQAGATFYFTLPASDEEPAVTEPQPNGIAHVAQDAAQNAAMNG